MRAFWSFCAIAFFSAAGACSRREAPAPVAETGAPTPSTTTPTFTLPDPYATAEPTKGKIVGNTSLVMKLTLEGDVKAAFRPRSRRPLGDRRYKSQIAVYRLARALGLDNVLRAIPRAFDATKLRRVTVGGDVLDREALPDADGMLRGALEPWIEGYEVVPLEQPAWRAKWEKWLTDASTQVPEDQQALARAISTMIVFDYVTANWDRWSGSNVATDRATGTLLYVDNDGAFYDAPSADALARQLALLQRVVRFSRSFAAALRALDEASLRAAIGEESPGAPLIGERASLAAAARARKASATIDARGEAALVFE